MILGLFGIILHVLEFIQTLVIFFQVLHDGTRSITKLIADPGAIGFPPEKPPVPPILIGQGRSVKYQQDMTVLTHRALPANVFAKTIAELLGNIPGSRQFDILMNWSIHLFFHGN